MSITPLIPEPDPKHIPPVTNSSPTGEGQGAGEDGVPVLQPQRGWERDEPLDDTSYEIPRPLTAERRLLCLIVRQLAQELIDAIGPGVEEQGRQRSLQHVRQIAMYVCHIAYSLPMAEVADAFGLDRSTVSHACRMVEDRRDDPAYDAFVSSIERMASAVHLLAAPRC